MRDLVRTVPRVPALIVAVASLLLIADDWMPDTATIDTDLVATVLCFAIGATAIAMVAADWLDAARVARVARNSIKGAVVALVSVAISLVAVEYLARWVYRDITTTGDDRAYFSRRWENSGTVVFNARGFREREFVEAKAPGMIRIAVVGDSFTYANGLDAKYRFTEIMQRELPAQVQVLNFGMPGNNTPQHNATIRHDVLRLAPDFILIQWFVNDVEGDNSTGRPSFSNVMPVSALHEQLYRKSALYTLLNMRWTQFQAERSGGTYDEYMTRRFSDPQGEGARADRDAMLALTNVVRKAGIRFGFVLFPDSGFDLGDRYPFTFLHERELAFCAEQKLPCVDLRPAFAQIPDRRKLWVNRLDHHPSALANQIAALEILKTFEPEFLRE